MPQSINSSNSTTHYLSNEPYLKLFEKLSVGSTPVTKMVVEVEVKKVVSSPSNCTYSTANNKSVTLNRMDLPEDGVIYKSLTGRDVFDLLQVAVYPDPK